MTHTIRILLVLAITVALNAQQSQPAVVSDPASNRDFPPSLVPLTFPSHGVDVDGLLYLAGGAGPHGTVLLLHGLPGYEVNGDLAQSIRRAGWNVLLFHYRGTWGADVLTDCRDRGYGGGDPLPTRCNNHSKIPN